jgi:hypothetical protein
MTDFANWQTPAALAIVLMTLIAFIVRTYRRRSRSSDKGAGACGGDCGCSINSKKSTRQALQGQNHQNHQNTP